MRKTIPLIIIFSLILFTGCNNGTTNIPTIEEPEELTFETYSNSQFGFEFQYPSNWEIRQHPEGEKGRPLVIAKDGDYHIHNQNYFIIWPDVLAGYKIMSSEKESETDIVIDGVKAKKELYLYFDDTNETDIDDGYYRIYIYKNDKTIEFTMEYPNNNDDLYEKIINTIKFI